LPVKLQLLTITICISNLLFAQNPFIHAESVGEWRIKEKITPEYHYNSIGVYLVNEQQLKSLFNPDNFSREERKQTGMKLFDKVESLFFQLDIPNPQKEDDFLSFPLYTFDLTPNAPFKSSRSEGRILDRISDEELNGRGIEATARIELVSKNELLEVAYKISSNINKLLGNGVFEKPDIWKVMQKAQSFFENRYKGKMVAEFSIPILPEREDYEYLIESASLYQIKWNFQEKVKSYKNNIWSELTYESTTTEPALLDRPSRLSKFKKHPFLLVIRYKSAYALPKEQQLNVSFTEEYLKKRRANLLEFGRGSIQHEAEAVFTELLRQAIVLQKTVDNYLDDKSNGDNDKQTLLTISEQQYDILSQHQEYFSQLTEEEVSYYEKFYNTTYFKFFNRLETLLLQDPQIKKISQVPAQLIDWQTQPKDSLSAEKLYQYLATLQSSHTWMSKEAYQGEFPNILSKEIQTIEQALFSAISAQLPDSQQEQLEQYPLLEQQYPLCTYCRNQFAKQQSTLSDGVEKELRATLVALQSQQLKYGRCFASLEKTATAELKKQFPTPTSLSDSEQKLYQAFEDKIASLLTLSSQFFDISTLVIADLSIKELEEQLTTYQRILKQYEQHACNLLHGGIFSKADLLSLEYTCKIEMP